MDVITATEIPCGIFFTFNFAEFFKFSYMISILIMFFLQCLLAHQYTRYRKENFELLKEQRQYQQELMETKKDHEYLLNQCKRAEYQVLGYETD